MATLTNYSFSYKIAVFSDCQEDSGLGSSITDSGIELVDNSGRFPQAETDQIGPRIFLQEYQSRVSEEETFQGGKSNESVFYLGTHWGSTSLLPQINRVGLQTPGMLKPSYPQGIYTLQEVWNHTSVSEATESAKRHYAARGIDSDAPIVVKIYSRGEKVADFNRVDELTTIQSSDQTALKLYDNSPHISWTRVDTSVKEFMIDSYLSSGSELVANADPSYFVGPYYESTTTDTSLDDLIPGLDELTGSGTQLYGKYYPTKTSDYKLYVQLDATSPLADMVMIDDFSTSTDPYEYQLLPWENSIYTLGLSEGYPDVKYFAQYTAWPSVEYCIKGQADRDKVVLVQEDIRRLEADEDSFVLVQGEQPRVVSLEVKVPQLSLLGPEVWGSAYYGGSSVEVIVQAKDSEGEVVPDIPVSVVLDGGENETFNGVVSGDHIYTNKKGEASFLYTPPPLGDKAGYKLINGWFGTNMVADFEYFPLNTQYSTLDDVYLYQVMKDDPLIGKANADTSIGEVPWNPGIGNGRKVIMYAWDTAAMNPLTNSTGAYAPIHPTEYSGGFFTFDSILPEPDSSTSTANMLGAYWVVGPRELTVSASVNSPEYGTATARGSVITALSNAARGDYYLSGVRRPYGWRLPDSLSDVASQLGGALYICLNPLSGEYDILYQGNPNGQTAVYPRAGLDFGFELI